MNENTLDHSTLAQLVEAGAVHQAHIVGCPGGWALKVTCGSVSRTLAAQRSRQPRVFRRMDTVVSYLIDVGIPRFDVDASSHTNDGPKTTSRPDRAEAMRRTHEAAAHDKWFREEVEKALLEANDPHAEWVDHDLVKQDIAEQRSSLAAKIKGRST